MRKRIAGIILTALFFAGPAYAQSASAPANPWSAEVSVGWDINVSGALFKSGIGTIDGRPTVIEEQSYGDVFGTGVQWRFGAGQPVVRRGLGWLGLQRKRRVVQERNWHA